MRTALTAAALYVTVIGVASAQQGFGPGQGNFSNGNGPQMNQGGQGQNFQQGGQNFQQGGQNFQQGQNGFSRGNQNFFDDQRGFTRDNRMFSRDDLGMTPEQLRFSLEMRQNRSQDREQGGDPLRFSDPNLGEEVIVKVVNKTATPVSLYWVDLEGREVLYAEEIAAGTTYEQSTFPNHKWRIKYRTATVGEFTAEAAPLQQYVLNPPRIASKKTSGEPVVKPAPEPEPEPEVGILPDRVLQFKHHGGYSADFIVTCEVYANGKWEKRNWEALGLTNGKSKEFIIPGNNRNVNIVGKGYFAANKSRTIFENTPETLKTSREYNVLGSKTAMRHTMDVLPEK